MGNDGGCIPRRTDMVPERKKEIKKDYVSMNQSRAKFCALSNARLKQPMVGCKMGFQYNKEAVYKCIIDKTIPRAFKHIKKPRNMKEIVATENPDKLSIYPFICPQSQIEYNGLTKFVYLWSCGCMMSYKLLENARDMDSTCPNCGKIYEKNDIVSLSYTPEQLEKKKKIMFYVPDKIENSTPVDEVEEAISEAVKKLKTDEEELRKKEEEECSTNILDAQAIKGSTKGVWKGLFHKEHKLECANDLTFRNTRFGIR